MKTEMKRLDWRVPETDRGAVRELAHALGASPLVAQLLINRGITSVSDAERFLDPTAAALTPPTELTDMEPAVARIRRARERNEHIRVYGDYDVDGIAGTALLVTALRRFGIEKCSYALPSRLTDGYGLRPDGVQQAQQDGADLLVTVDNGIKAHDAAAEATRAGIDLIVTDHHTLDGALPDAVAVINPRREAKDSPVAELAGAAVASKLAAALHENAQDFDFVALGTVADLVPLRGENRSLVARGLERIRTNPRPGIAALARRAGVRLDDLRSESIAFQLGPRINAGGRVGVSTTGLELLLADDPAQAARHAEELHAANEERRRIERRIFEEARDRLGEALDEARQTIVLGDERWHPGVIGIVAARLLGAYHRPVALVAFDDEGVGRGSARSAPEFELAARLETCAEMLERYGGHRAAGGFTIQRDRLESFAEQFEQEARRFMPGGAPAPALDVDAIVSLSQIDSQVIRTMDRLEPFGAGNPAPILAAFGVEVLPNSIRELRGGHLRLAVRQGPQIFSAIGFNMADRVAAGHRYTTADIAFSPKFNTWRGETTIQLHLKDIRFDAQ